MSAVAGTGERVRDRFAHVVAVRPDVDRTLALVGAATLTAAYVAVLYRVVDVVGGPGGVELFALEVVASVALGAGLAAALRLRTAVALGAVLFALGLGAYLLTIPPEALDPVAQLRDTVALVTGLSVLRMVKAGVWALGFTPGPLFVSTYLFVRRHYALGVLVGGAALGFFLSTGDVGPVHGLVGALGAVTALGFGRLDLEAGTGHQRQAVVVLLVAILVVTTSVSLVPGGEARPLLPGGGGATVESSLVDTGDTVDVLGSITLSPTVRYTVTAERPARWRVGAYDRFTGDGWVRSGLSEPYANQLGFPEGDEITRLRQTYEVESETSAMPAAWKPTRVGAGAERTRVTTMGGLQPLGDLEPGDRYSVESHRDTPSTLELRGSGTDYPEDLHERFTQLPESTPARLGEFTARLTAEADNPYDTARVVEQWLEANKAYSLDVDRPDGDVAAAFVFEMDRGYCVYYATAMVAMLRSQGIPARFVVGYTTGQQVAEDRWVVRGLDSHAWVEVYFPHQGWVAFDPTPAGPRQTAERARLAQARVAGMEDVDTGETRQQALTPSGAEDDAGLTASPPEGGSAEGDPLDDQTPTIPPGLRGDGGGAGGTGDGGGLGGQLPDERTLLYGLILLVGAATAAHRSGLARRARRSLWLRRSPGGPPRRRIEATFERLDYLLGRRYRPRRTGETPREYLASIRSRFTTGARRQPYGLGRLRDDGPSTDPYDGRLDRLFDLYERAHYAGRVEPGDAETAWRLLGELREEWSLLNR